jgi:hypothetical protein
MRVTQNEEYVSSYMMLFCALMLVNSSKATVDQAVKLVPLAGNAKLLAQQMVELRA